jgi:NADPH-dependent stearoyl-CoA 9-desaturase
MPQLMYETPLDKLSEEQIEELGKEFDKIHDEVFAELGDRDRKYITSMIEMHRRLLVL